MQDLLCSLFIHSVKSLQRVFSGPNFPVFGPNTEIYGVNLGVQSEYMKIRTRKNSLFGHFLCSDYFHLLECFGIFSKLYEISFSQYRSSFQIPFGSSNIIKLINTWLVFSLSRNWLCKTTHRDHLRIVKIVVKNYCTIIKNPWKRNIYRTVLVW